MSAGLYVYGIAPATGIGRPPRITGLEGAPVFLINHGTLFVFVHECRDVLTLRDEAHLTELALAHSAVVEKIWDWAGTVLPISFGTIIQSTGDSTAEENIRAWLDVHQAGMLAMLGEFAGKVELGVQIFREPADADVDADPQVEELRGRIREMSQGAAYLYRQKLDRLVRSRMEVYQANLCQNYLQRLQPLVADFRRNQLKPAPAGAMLMNLAVLVKKEDIARLGEELAAINREKGTRVRFTGPWPPYNFIPPDFSGGKKIK